MTYKEQLSHPEWQKKRLQILERDNFCCTACYDTETTLHIHHKRYDKGKLAWQYEDANFQAFCAHCHSLAEYLKERGLFLILSTKKPLPDNNSIFITSISKSSEDKLCFSMDALDLSDNHVEHFFRGSEKNLKEILDLFELAKKL